MTPARSWLTVARLLAAAALVPTATGCTYALWTPATQTRAVGPEIAGVVRNYPDRGQRSLVVTYRARGDGTDVDLVVPLDADGRPVPPFAPAADSDGLAVVGHVVWFPDPTADGPVAGRVPAGQLAGLLGRGGDPKVDRDALARHRTATDFSAAVGPMVNRPLYAGGTERPGTATLLGYRFDAAGQLVRVPVNPPSDPTGDPPGTAAVHVPAGTRLVLVPVDVDRPPGDQGRDQVVAVALTPLAVAGDAAGAGAIVGLGAAALGVTLAAVVVVLPVAAVVALVSHPAEKDAKAKTSADVARAAATRAAATRPTGPVAVPVVVDPGA